MATAVGSLRFIPCIMPPLPPAAACQMTSLPRDRNTPGQLADLDALDDLESGDVDDRHVVRHAVGGQKIFFVGRECHLPDPLPDQKVFLDLVRLRVDYGDAIGGTERDEGGLSVGADTD